MQTFLPYESFEASAKCLDYRRLGKQRVEAMQLIRAIETNGVWSRHPAAKMWREYVPALTHYMNCMIREWIVRGYKNKMKVLPTPLDSGGHLVMPFWLGDKKFHISHQSNLLRKDPNYYGKYFYNIPDNLPYVWPV